MSRRSGMRLGLIAGNPSKKGRLEAEQLERIGLVLGERPDVLVPPLKTGDMGAS